jgi:hypothetical protein
MSDACIGLLFGHILYTKSLRFRTVISGKSLGGSMKSNLLGLLDEATVYLSAREVQGFNECFKNLEATPKFLVSGRVT